MNRSEKCKYCSAETPDDCLGCPELRPKIKKDIITARMGGELLPSDIKKGDVIGSIIIKFDHSKHKEWYNVIYDGPNKLKLEPTGRKI
jgi:hypothetical protein